MITLQKDIFDTLDLVSHAYGGVGAGADFVFTGYDFESAPCCIHGLAYDAAESRGFVSSDIGGELARLGITRVRNDEAVRAINVRKKRPLHARVDFITEYCPELGIVRGE